MLVPLVSKAAEMVALLPLTNPFASAALKSGTFAARTQGWNYALAHASSFLNPIGHGIGAVFVGSRLGIVSISVPHNGILEMLYEVGLVGVLLFLLVIISLWKTGIDTIDRMHNKELRDMTAAIIGVEFGILFYHGLFNSFMPMYPVSVYFWFLLGALSCLERLDSR